MCGAFVLVNCVIMYSFDCGGMDSVLGAIIGFVALIFVYDL